MRRTKRRSHLNLAFVESSGDWLSPEVGKLLAETFNCKVINHYGCLETYTIAYGCDGGALHLCEDAIVAELHPDEETNEYELIVSSIIFETMPFIRYRVGDFIQPSEI